MLWAQRPQNDAELMAAGIGALLAAVICGSIPITQGIAQRLPVLGVILGVFTGGIAFLTGCCGGLPTALICCGILAFASQMMPPPMSSMPQMAQPMYDDDYDVYARPFQLGGRDRGDGERPRHYTERDRDRAHEERFGFRPRRRSDPPEALDVDD